MPVPVLKSILSDQDFIEEMAMRSIEPWGDDRQDWNNANICATIMNSVRVKGDAAQPKDFLLEFKKKEVDLKTLKPSSRTLENLKRLKS